MKLHLPTGLFIAVMATMSAAYALPAEKYTPDESITNSMLTESAVRTEQYIITKDGEDNLLVTGEVDKYASLCVREGTMTVGDGSTTTTLTVTPGNIYAGSLTVAGKDAKVVFNKATMVNGNAGYRAVGGLDGNGTLEITNGSVIQGDCNLFAIGVSEVHTSASPWYTAKSSTDTSAYEGNMTPAKKEGSDKMFGRGDVIVSGGSKLDTAYNSFYMGEGSLTVIGSAGAESSVTIGQNTNDTTKRTHGIYMGMGSGTTSEIFVKEHASITVNAYRNQNPVPFSTSVSEYENTTARIIVDGENAKFNLEGDTQAFFGVTGNNNDTQLQVKNGASANLKTDSTIFGDKDSGNKVDVEVCDASSTLNIEGYSAMMDEGTTMTNKGTINITTKDPNKGFFVHGGELNNEEGAEINQTGDFCGSGTGKINNDGSIKASRVYVYGSTTVSNSETGTLEAASGFVYVTGNGYLENHGTVKASTTLSVNSSKGMVNYGTIDCLSSVYGGGTLVGADGSTMAGLKLGDGGTFFVDGLVTMNGNLTTHPGESGQVVFSPDGSLDMNGKAISADATSPGIEFFVAVDGHVNQLTTVAQRDLITNFDEANSEIDENTTVVLVGSDGSASVRELGNLNQGALTTASGNQSAFFSLLEKLAAAPGAPQELSALVNSRNPEYLDAMLDTLSGHELATAMSSQVDGNLGHLRRLRGAMGKGTPLGTTTSVTLCSANNKGEGVGYVAPVTTGQRWRAGVQAYHEESELDADSHGDGYDRSETGAMLTAEYYVREGLTLGGALSRGRTTLKSDGARKRHEDNTSLDFYALYGKNRWQFASAIGFGMHEHDLKRTATSAEADGYSVNFLQDVAYTVLAREKVTVQMFGTIESSWNKMDGFTEKGAYALRVDDQDAWTTDVTVGVRYNHMLPAWGNAPAGVFSAQAGVTGTLGDVDAETEMSLNGFRFSQESARRDRWGWNIGVGVDVPVRSNVSIYATAETVVRGDSSSVDGQIGVKVAF